MSMMLRRVYRRRQGGGSVDPVPGYTAKWTMNDNSGADETGNFDATPTGTTTTITGIVDTAQEFNGSQCYVASLGSQDPDEITVALWLQHYNTVSYSLQVGLAGYARFIDIRYQAVDNVVFFYLEGATVAVSLPGCTGFPAQYTVVNSVSGGFLRVYFMGVLVYQRAATNTAAGVLTVTMGAYSSLLHEPMTGFIDDVRVYMSALSASQVASLSPLPVDSIVVPGAVSRLVGDDTTGLDATHRLAWRRYGTLSTTTGAIDTAIALGGTQGLTQSILSFGAPVDDMTITGWFRINTAAATSGWVCYCADSANGRLFDIYMISATNIRMYSTVLAINQSIVCSRDTWHHFALVNDQAGGYCNFYFDGALTGTYGGKASVAQTLQTVHIGHNAGSGFVSDGAIEDWRIYDYAISASDISALYSMKV